MMPLLYLTRLRVILLAKCTIGSNGLESGDARKFIERFHQPRDVARYDREQEKIGQLWDLPWSI